VVDDGLDEVRRHLHLPDAGLRLRVGDAEAGAVLVVEANVSDAQVAQLAGAHPAAAKDLAHRAPADVAAPDVRAQPAHVPRDRALGNAELGGDLRRPLPLREQVRDEPRRRPEVGQRRRGGQRRVLRGGCIEQDGQLVHLQERSPRLRHAHAHALAARRVVVDVTVLDRVAQDRRERVDQLADRGCSERHGAPAATVADVGTGVERDAQLVRLPKLAGLEREAEVRVDRVEPAVAEEGEQVVREPPAVVGDRVRRDPLVANRAVDLRLEPPGGVDVEGRYGAVLGRRRECWRRLGRRPHADADAREDVAQLRPRAGLVPAAAKAARAAWLLVEDHALALGADAEAQIESARAVRQRAREDGAGRQRCHQATSARPSWKC
jgi:hypothetical protein